MPHQPPEALGLVVALALFGLYALNTFTPRRFRSWLRRTFRLDP